MSGIFAAGLAIGAACVFVAAFVGCARAGFDATDARQQDGGSEDARLGDLPSGVDAARDAVPVFDGPHDLIRADAAVDPSFSWAQRFGSTSWDYNNALVVDTSGNVFISGSIRESVDFGGGILSGAGDNDIYLASFGSSGVYHWAHRFGAGNYDVGHDLALDGGGNAYLAGTFSGDVDFGSGLLSATNGDIIVASYSGTGTPRWSKHTGGDLNDYGYAVAVAPNGDVILAGWFQGSVLFGGSNTRSSQGGDDFYLACYDSAQNFRWARTIGSPGKDQAYDLAVDASGNIYATGGFEQTINFASEDLVSTGASDIFLISVDGAGLPRWAKRFGGSEDDHGYGVATDVGGNVYLSGRFKQSIDLGGGQHTSAGHYDVFVASFGTDGSYRWSKTFGSAEEDGAFTLTIGPAGHLYVGGFFAGSVDVGLSDPLVSAGGTDAIFVSYTLTGLPRWAKRFGSVDNDYGGGVGLDAQGNIYLSGHFQGTVDFGGGPLTSAGEHDIYLVKLTP